MPSHAYAKFVQKKKGKYYIGEQALKEHFDLGYDSPPETENEQKSGCITYHFIEHLRTENRELYACIKELTHLVAQQNKMINDKNGQIKFLNTPGRRNWWDLVKDLI